MLDTVKFRFHVTHHCYRNDMYNKLFNKILDSSIWLENQPTRLVWITFIACMDQDGTVALSSIGNVANRARVSAEEAAEAIHCLESPDVYNPDQDNEGRRIERVPGVGWTVINAPKYRDIVKAETVRAQTRERVRRFRDKTCNANVTQDNENETPSVSVSEALSEAEEQKQPLREKVKSPSAQKQENHEPDSYMAAKAFGELAGFNGNQNLYIAKQAMETYRRRKPEMPMQGIPQAILSLWREYDGMEIHGKVSMKTFLGELGRFLDSDSWRKKEKAPQAPKPQNGHKPANPTPEWAFRKPQ